MSALTPRDRGASAVVVAGALIMIMGIAAIAIDGGMAFSERRQAQTAVDFAALGALQAAISCASASGCDEPTAADAGASEAQAIVAENLPGRSIVWNTCTDPNPLARVAPSNACVSFTHTFDEARVVLPDDVLDTSFGGVIGQDTVTISADAQAGQKIDSSALVVPFAFSPGPHFCLWENQAPQTTPPCSGPSSGNFGILDIAVYGNPQYGTTENCGTGGSGPRLVSNIEVGTDHVLAVYSSGDAVVNDQDACPNLSESPNEVEVQTGSGLTRDISNALIENDPTARLRCDTGSISCVTIRDTSLDDTGLWQYLTPGACGATAPATREDMKACLENWTSGVIFTDAIADNPRFVAVPVLPTFPGSGFGMHLIDGFEPVYLETVYAGQCTGSDQCDLMFSPGEPWASDPCPAAPPETLAACGYTSNGNWNGARGAQGLTGFALHPDMLPESIRDDLPGTDGQREFALTE